ncbi:putative nuclear migration protein [Sesbania bispinosa]|nr:putative nuclear migration protein [Sesbania bispinosa]
MGKRRPRTAVQLQRETMALALVRDGGSDDVACDSEERRSAQQRAAWRTV